MDVKQQLNNIKKIWGETKKKKKKKKKKGPHLILVGKLGKLGPIRKIHWVNQEMLSENQENYAKLGKNLQNWEKKNCEIRKFLPNQESSLGILGKNWKIRKIGKFHQEKQPDIRKVHPNILGKFGVRPKKKKKVLT